MQLFANTLVRCVFSSLSLVEKTYLRKILHLERLSCIHSNLITEFGGNCEIGGESFVYDMKLCYFSIKFFKSAKSSFNKPLQWRIDDFDYVHRVIPREQVLNCFGTNYCDTKSISTLPNHVIILLFFESSFTKFFN